MTTKDDDLQGLRIILGLPMRASSDEARSAYEGEDPMLIAMDYVSDGEEFDADPDEFMMPIGFFLMLNFTTVTIVYETDEELTVLPREVGRFPHEGEISWPQARERMRELPCKSLHLLWHGRWRRVVR